MGNREKVVIVVGAGSTYSDGLRCPIEFRPPLNMGFFSNCKKDMELSDSLDKVRKSLIRLYGVDPLVESNDNLESILVKVHSDLLCLGTHASGRGDIEEVFRNLVFLLNSRMAHTTNELEPTKHSNIRKILSLYLNKTDFTPQDLCFVTFNYDLHIERNLEKMDSLQMYGSHKGTIFNFPYLYGLGEDIRVTNPRSGPTFAEAESSRKGRIALLKLHGSLNWYSSHTSSKPSYNALCNAERTIRVTSRQVVNPDMYIKRGKKRWTTYPVVVPPIIGKAAVFHQRIKKVWAAARHHLSTATEVVIFGYSFPSGDYESVNMLENAVGKNEHCRHVRIINPDPSVVLRMGLIPKNKPITLFPDAKSFLATRAR